MYVPSWFDVRMVVNAFMMRCLPAGWLFTWSPREITLLTYRQGVQVGRFMLRYRSIRNTFEVLHRRERFYEESISTTIVALPFLGTLQLTMTWLGRVFTWIGFYGLTANKEMLAILTPKRDWLWDYSKTWQALGQLVVKESIIDSRSSHETLVVPHRTSQYARSEHSAHVVVKLVMREWRIRRWLGFGPITKWFEDFEFFCPDPPTYQEVYLGEQVTRTASRLLTHRRRIEDVDGKIWYWENYASERTHIEPVFVQIVEELRYSSNASLQIASRGHYCH